MPTECLEAVVSAQNPDFLAHDFYMQTVDGFHHQFYFGHFVGRMAALFSLSPEHALSWVALFNLALTFCAAYYACRELDPTDRLFPLIGVVLLSVTPPLFVLGGWSLLLPFARPWIMVQPLLILALLWCWQGRIYLSVAAAGLAALFHPLLGGTVGAVCLIASLENAKKCLLALVLLVVLMLPNIIPALLSYQAMSLDTSTFIEIIAKYRHPMHYIPSSWNPHHFLHFLWTTLAIVICLLSSEVRALINRQMMITLSCFLGLMVVGYVFVEVFPTRLGTTLVGFRYSIYVYFVYLLILAKYCSLHLQKGREGIWLVVALLTAVFLTHSPLVLFVLLLVWHVFQRYPISAKIVLGLALLAGIRAMFRHPDISSVIGWSVAVSIITLSIHPWVLKASSGVLACLLVWQTVHAPGHYWSNEGRRFLPVVLAVKRLTPEDAVLVTPLEGEVLRTQGPRALVASHNFPFLDRHFLPWYERAQAVWGRQSLDRQDAKNAYLSITDDKLRQLHEQYAATHAVLYAETQSNLQVLFENGDYKLVRLLPDSE